MQTAKKQLVIIFIIAFVLALLVKENNGMQVLYKSDLIKKLNKIIEKRKQNPALAREIISRILKAIFRQNK